MKQKPPCMVQPIPMILTVELYHSGNNSCQVSMMINVGRFYLLLYELMLCHQLSYEHGVSCRKGTGLMIPYCQVMINSNTTCLRKEATSKYESN